MCHRKAHSLEGAVEVLGYDASSANDGHHVGVTAPTGNHVEVEMLLDSGSGCFTDVETNVESMRAVDFPHRRHEVLGGPHHLGQRLLVNIGELAAVVDWGDHRMSCCIGVEVEECERPRVAPQGQGRTIVLRRERIAEDALTTVTIVGSRHVLEPPGREEDLDHRSSLLEQFFSEVFPRLEVWDLLGRHMDLLTRLGVAAGSFAALADTKRPEPAKFHFLIATKGRDDALQNNLHNLVRLFPRDVGSVSHSLHKISFGHRHVAVLLAPPQPVSTASVLFLLVITLGFGLFFGLFLGNPLFGVAAIHLDPGLRLHFRFFGYFFIGNGLDGIPGFLTFITG